MFYEKSRELLLIRAGNYLLKRARNELPRRTGNALPIRIRVTSLYQPGSNFL
jgi:hypothetical protein